MAEVEGSILEVCEECLEYGKKIEKVKPPRKRKVRKKVNFERKKTVLIRNYGRTIIEARRKMGLRRDEFAKKINEKESVIGRVENEEMVPDIKLMKKIEDFLGVDLMMPYEGKERKIKGKDKELTIGDVTEVG